MRMPISNSIQKLPPNQKRAILCAFLVIFLSIYPLTYRLADSLQTAYQNLESSVIKDRHEKIIKVESNEKGYYARKTKDVPQKFIALLLKKEDRFFYYHPGINPFSILRDA